MATINLLGETDREPDSWWAVLWWRKCGERGGYGSQLRESTGDSEIREVFPEEVPKIQRIDSTQPGHSMGDA